MTHKSAQQIIETQRQDWNRVAECWNKFGRRRCKQDVKTIHDEFFAARRSTMVRKVAGWGRS